MYLANRVLPGFLVWGIQSVKKIHIETILIFVTILSSSTHPPEENSIEIVSIKAFPLCPLNEGINDNLRTYILVENWQPGIS